jgi:hypothetical protein
MRRLAAILALVLGLTLLAAPPASVAVAAHAENRASGSASDPNNLIRIEARLSERSVRENIALDYDIASDDSVAAGGAGRAANGLKPDPAAEGAHSTFKRDPTTGKVTGHAEWQPNPRNPSGFDQAKRVDVTGDPHFNKATRQDVPTPHVHEKGAPGGVRPARPDEVPQ